MAKSRYDVEINGDNKGLTVAVNKSMDQLNKLDSAANGLFSGLTGPLGNLQGGLNSINSMSPALRGLGAAGMVAAAGIAAMTSTMAKANELQTISTNTGVSIEMLQKLQQEFKATGMEVEKFGDINKDALDKIGDSMREGKGGVADDLKAWGIGLQELTQYAVDAEGGIKAVIDVYYKMQKSGKSKAEITNAMESMASDASHLISTLEKYENQQEALNAINKQSARITAETALETKEFDKHMKEFGGHVDTVAIAIGGPLIKSLNDLWNFMQKDWGQTEYVKMMEYLPIIGQTLRTARSGWDLTGGKEEADFQRDLAAAKAKAEMNFQITKQREEQTAAAAAKRKELDEQARKDQEAANKKAKAGHDKALADAKKAAEEQIKLRKEYIQSMAALSAIGLDNDVLGMGIGSDQKDKLKAAGLSDALIWWKEFESIQSNIKNMDMSTLSQSYQDMNTQSVDFTRALKASFEAGKITADEYEKQLDDLAKKRASFMVAARSDESMTEHSLDIPGFFQNAGWLTTEESQQYQIGELSKQLNEMQDITDNYEKMGIISHETAAAARLRIDQMYANKSRAIELQSAQQKVQIADDIASGIAGSMQFLMGENSKAAQAMFAVSKGISIANGMINAHESATKAMAMYPGPMGYAMAAASYAKVVGEVMSMKSVTMGQFHDGIDNVPNTGTYLLEGGERVVDKRLNEDLKQYLKTEEQQPSGQPIDASINIGGSVMDEKTLMATLKKQQQTVASIVQSANRRRQ